MFDRRLKRFDVTTNLQTKLIDIVDWIQVVKKIQILNLLKSVKNILLRKLINFMY